MPAAYVYEFAFVFVFFVYLSCSEATVLRRVMSITEYSDDIMK